MNQPTESSAQRCVYCGAQLHIIWVHGHGQCMHCKTNVDECCRGEQCDTDHSAVRSQGISADGHRIGVSALMLAGVLACLAPRPLQAAKAVTAENRADQVTTQTASASANAAAQSSETVTAGAVAYDPAKDPRGWVPKGQENLDPQDIKPTDDFWQITWILIVGFIVPALYFVVLVRKYGRKNSEPEGSD